MYPVFGDLCKNVVAIQLITCSTVKMVSLVNTYTQTVYSFEKKVLPIRMTWNVNDCNGNMFQC